MNHDAFNSMVSNSRLVRHKMKTMEEDNAQNDTAVYIHAE